MLCEKPWHERRRGEEAFAAAERTGFLITEAFMYRHHPQTKRLARAVAEGAIGELRLVRSAFCYGALRRRRRPPAPRSTAAR